jgi:hypothetical protein
MPSWAPSSTGSPVYPELRGAYASNAQTENVRLGSLVGLRYPNHPITYPRRHTVPFLVPSLENRYCGLIFNTPCSLSVPVLTHNARSDA